MNKKIHPLLWVAGLYMYISDHLAQAFAIVAVLFFAAAGVQMTMLEDVPTGLYYILLALLLCVIAHLLDELQQR